MRNQPLIRSSTPGYKIKVSSAQAVEELCWAGFFPSNRLLARYNPPEEIMRSLFPLAVVIANDGLFRQS